MLPMLIIKIFTNWFKLGSKKLRILWEIFIEKMHAMSIKKVFFNKIIWGSGLIKFFSLIDKIMQTMKFTIPDERTRPTTPKLEGKRLPEFGIGAPISIQSHKKLRPIPYIDKLKGKLISSIE